MNDSIITMTRTFGSGEEADAAAGEAHRVLCGLRIANGTFSVVLDDESYAAIVVTDVYLHERAEHVLQQVQTWKGGEQIDLSLEDEEQIHDFIQEHHGYYRASFGSES